MNTFTPMPDGSNDTQNVDDSVKKSKVSLSTYVLISCAAVFVLLSVSYTASYFSNPAPAPVDDLASVTTTDEVRQQELDDLLALMSTQESATSSDVSTEESLQALLEIMQQEPPDLLPVESIDSPVINIPTTTDFTSPSSTEL